MGRLQQYMLKTCYLSLWLKVELMQSATKRRLVMESRGNN